MLFIFNLRSSEVITSAKHKTTDNMNPNVNDESFKVTYNNEGRILINMKEVALSFILNRLVNIMIQTIFRK